MPIDSLSLTAGELTDTMHKLRETTEGITRNTRSVDRVLLQLEEQPASLLFGRSPPPPGPGEEGFVSPRENYMKKFLVLAMVLLAGCAAPRAQTPAAMI